MSSLLKSIIPQIEQWPEEDQAALLEAARGIEAARKGIYNLTPEEEVAVSEGLADADAGRFATETSMKKLAQRYGA